MFWAMWIRARLRLAMPFVRLPTEVASTLHSTASEESSSSR
jgi:hypothetical protein